jgi:hypothetical protein
MGRHGRGRPLERHRIFREFVDRVDAQLGRAVSRGESWFKVAHHDQLLTDFPRLLLAFLDGEEVFLDVPHVVDKLGFVDGNFHVRHSGHMGMSCA